MPVSLTSGTNGAASSAVMPVELSPSIVSTPRCMSTMYETTVENGENGGSSQLSVFACIESVDANGRVGDAGGRGARPGRRTGSLYSVTATECTGPATTCTCASDSLNHCRGVHAWLLASHSASVDEAPSEQSPT